MAVKFQPKPGKPHIRFTELNSIHFLVQHTHSSPGKRLTRDQLRLSRLANDYCARVNPGCYNSPGEAARALHYGSAK